MSRLAKIAHGVIGLCGIIIVTGSLFVSTLSQAQAADSLTAEERRTFEEMIHDYIMDHPEVVLQSVEAYRNRQESAGQEHVRATIASLGDSIRNDPMTPVGGNPDGTITVVEFFDYRCGYCKRALSAVNELIDTDPNIRLVFMEFPILGEESVMASRASLAIWNT